MRTARLCIRLRCLQRAFARFARARSGNVAITFAIALIPMLGMVGAAIDFSRANAVKASMQAAVDATTLMVSKNAASLAADALQTNAQSYFLAQFTRPEAKNVTLTAIYTSSGGSSLVITASADMDTQFIGILGLKSMNIVASSTAKWGSARLRVALVLDTTGSMASDGKIDALKTATKNLLTQLQAAASVNGDVYVSIIPFSKNVNLDSANSSATWIDWTDWEDEPDILDAAKGGSKPSNWYSIKAGSSCPFSSSSYGFGCVSTAQGSTNVSSIPSSGNSNGLICPGADGGNRKSTKIGIIYNGCYNTWTKCVGSKCACTTTNTSICSCSGSGSSKTCQPNTGYREHTWRPSTSETYSPPLASSGGVPYATPAHNTWNGCVTDRGTTSGPSSDYDRLVTAPTTSIVATLFPAEQNFYCSPAVMGLSYDWSAMKAQVDGLTPNGATNQPIGLVWGWQSLVGGGPLSAPAKDSNYTYTDVIILLSDGLNTLDRWYGNGSSTNTSVDARMLDSAGSGTCANINAAGITLYTIQVNTGGDATSTLLQKCAGSPGKFPDSSKFYLLTSANQIITTFDTIGTNLTKLRIAQ